MTSGEWIQSGVRVSLVVTTGEKEMQSSCVRESFAAKHGLGLQVQRG